MNLTKSGSEKVTFKEYRLAHKWLADTFGVANRCESELCKKTSTRFEYALIAGKKHECVRENYIPLCRTCHARYDKENDNNGHIINPQPRLSMKLLRQFAFEFGLKYPEKADAVNKLLDYVETRTRYTAAPTQPQHVNGEQINN